MNKRISYIPHAHNVQSKLPESWSNIVDMPVDGAAKITLLPAKTLHQFLERNEFPSLFHALKEEQGDLVIGRGKIQQDVVENDDTGDVTVSNGMARYVGPWHKWLERKLFPVGFFL